MRILFAHKNFPAQFGAFGEWLAGQGWEVAFLTQRAGAASAAFRVVACPAEHRTPAEGIQRYVRPLEGAAITGQAFARAAVDLDRSGFTPDIVMSHAGWGVGTFLKDVWPATCAIPYFEWYYNWPYPDRTPYDAEAADPPAPATASATPPSGPTSRPRAAPSARPASRRRSSPRGCATG